MRARRGEQQSEVGSGAARHRKTNRERKQDRDEEDRRAAAHIPYTYGQTGPSSPAYPVGVKPALTLVLGGLIAACALGVGAFLALRGGEPAPRAERPARTAPEPAARPTRNLAARVPAGDTIALRDRPAADRGACPPAARRARGRGAPEGRPWARARRRAAPGTPRRRAHRRRSGRRARA